jgi:hypothetical protein
VVSRTIQPEAGGSAIACPPGVNSTGIPSEAPNHTAYGGHAMKYRRTVLLLANAGTVEGDFTATDVIGITTQQLEAGNLDKVLKAIRSGQTYANVHSMTSTGGEIRGQIRDDDHGHRD